MNMQKNIVIVDDEIDILEILKINIERNNYKAHCFQMVRVQYRIFYKIYG